MTNKELVNKYPWISPDGNSEFIWWDDMPIGWRIAFGDMLAEEINNAINISDFEIYQVKEKYGELVIYHNGNEEVTEVIEKYSALSSNICCFCGKPDTYMFDDFWVHAECEDCYKGSIPYKDRIIGDGKMAKAIANRVNGVDVVTDISETADKIRSAYDKRRTD